MLIPVACKYSDVMNCDTNDDLPTPHEPNITTLYGGVIPGQLAQLDSLDDDNEGMTLLAVPHCELQLPTDTPPAVVVPQTVTCSVLYANA